jgi:hypothetical protein
MLPLAVAMPTVTTVVPPVALLPLAIILPTIVVPPVAVVVPPDALLLLAVVVLPVVVVVPPVAVVVLSVAVVVPPVTLLPLAVAVPPLAIVVLPVAVAVLPVVLLPLAIVVLSMMRGPEGSATRGQQEYTLSLCFGGSPFMRAFRSTFFSFTSNVRSQFIVVRRCPSRKSFNFIILMEKPHLL